jgi:choline dehydrogenase-like flavoprotein
MVPIYPTGAPRAALVGRWSPLAWMHPSGAAARIRKREGNPLADVTSDAELRLLRAAVEVVAPPDAPLDALVEAVVDWLTVAPPQLRADVRLALRVLGARPSAMLTGVGWSGFADLSPPARVALLEAWERSPLPQARTIFQAVRRLILSSYYASSAGQAALGAPERFHRRAPEVAWEGPAEPYVSDPDGPFARGPRKGWLPPPPPSRGVPEAVRTRFDLRGEIVLDADVVVIGSGAGGAVAAVRAAEAGRKVVILETGSWWDAPDFDEDEAHQTQRLYADRGLRATEDLAFSVLQGETAGGGTTINWMMMLRTPEHVLDDWRRRHGLDVDDATMAAAFERIEREVHARVVSDDAHSANNRRLLDGAAALGWGARAGRINARGCVRAGTCGLGCRYGAKQGALEAWLPRAFAAGATLYADTHAERIERRGPGRRDVKRVWAVVRDPVSRAVVARIAVDAPIVVIAAGAVGTPALLQRSGMGGGGVGRWLRLHPTTAVIGRYAEPVVPSAGAPMTVHVDHFERRTPNGYGFWVQCPPLSPGLGAVAVPGFGESHAALLREYRNLGVFLGLTRDGAEEERSSGEVRVGSDGAPRLRYRLTEADADNVIASIQAAAKLHLAAGATEAVTLHVDPVRVRDESGLVEIQRRGVVPNRLGLFSAHVNGTCRIGTNPRSSGATPDGERHGAPGVYVMDGSLLPTGVGVNPQATIYALASVLSERMLG